MTAANEKAARAYTHALAAHERLERRMLRAMHAWEKSRAALARRSRALDDAAAASLDAEAGRFSETDPEFTDALTGI